MQPDLETKIRRMNDNDLLAIVHSQDFRPDARKLAWGILHGRGISEEVINHWRDPMAELAALNWCEGMSESELRRMFNHRRIIFRLTSSAFIIGILVPAYIGELMPVYIWVFFWPVSLICFFALNCIYWRTPLRILFLRPFNFPESHRRTRRFARRYLRYMGHTYTLSDAEVKPRKLLLESLLYIFLVAGQALWIYLLLRPPFEIHWDDDILRLKHFMSRRIACNINWALSWDKIFKISSTPETWKHAVQHLINSTQLIIIDLSYANAGLKWELDEILFYHATNKLVFVAHEDYFDWARSFLKTYGSSEHATRLFVYDDYGLAKRPEELIAMLASVATGSSTATD